MVRDEAAGESADGHDQYRSGLEQRLGGREEDVPEVVQAQRLFGDTDYLLRVVCEDLAAYERVYDEQLATLPGVQRLTSTLVMKDVVRSAQRRSPQRREGDDEAHHSRE